MAFNLGAFAGGLAKGGMDTYSALTDIEAKQQETKRREAEFGAWQKEQTGKEALRSAIAEQGGGQTFTPNFSGTGGMDSNDVAPTPVMQTPSERISRSTERAIQMGADPMAVMQYKQAARQDISADAAQQVFDWMQGSNKAVAEKGLVKAAEEYLVPHYNSNKGMMADGMTAKVVNTKVGPIVQFADDKGNIQHNLTQPLTMETFNKARDLVGSSMLMAAGPEHFYKGQELGLKQKEVGLKEKLLPSEIAKNTAAANQANAHASVYHNMLQTAKDSKEAGKAMEPYLKEFADMTPEDQAGSKGQAVLLKGATAGAQKSKDLAGIVTMLRKPDRAVVSAEQEKAAYTAYNEATTPEQIKAVKAKYPDVFGMSALDKAIAERTKANTGASAGAASSAIPEVSGRPLYNKSMSELQSMARKPRGVSTAEANDAQAELEARKGESRMSALPSN